MWSIHISSEDEKLRIEAAGGWVEGGYLNVHRKQVISSLATSRSFGDKVFKQNPSLRAEEQIVTAAPTISRIVAHANDVVLICCDGLFENMTSQEVKDFVCDQMQQQEDPGKLVANLLQESLEKGSYDNMSALFIKLASINLLLRLPHWTTHTHQEVADGRGFKGNEFILGPYNIGADDQWKEQYREFARTHAGGLDVDAVLDGMMERL